MSGSFFHTYSHITLIIQAHTIKNVAKLFTRPAITIVQAFVIPRLPDSKLSLLPSKLHQYLPADGLLAAVAVVVGIPPSARI